MEIQYRKLKSDDLETFIQLQINQLREEGATEDNDLVAPALRDSCAYFCLQEDLR